MKENKLVELSMEFSVDIINLVKFLKSNHETIIANQIGRSGTSIGANIHESKYAHGTADFIAKMQIALKECYESEYWLELLNRTGYIDDEIIESIRNIDINTLTPLEAMTTLHELIKKARRSDF